MIRPTATALCVLLLCGCPFDGDDGGAGPAGPAAVLPPIIGLVDPPTAWWGGEIRISGAGFGSTQGSVTVGGVAVTAIPSWTATEIRATVPVGAGSGSVVVTAGGVQSNPGYLVVPWNVADPVNVAVTGAALNQAACQVCSDGAGGAIVAWEDDRSGNLDIFVQRVGGAGATLWAPSNGVVISGLASNQQSCQIVADGAGGAIVAWQDFRNGNWDIFAQRVNASGAPQWVANGAIVSTAALDQVKVQLVGDGAGGAIIAWEDARSGVLDIYAQRMNAAGAAQWTANGVALCTFGTDQSDLSLVGDGAGGAIAAWQDDRGADLDIYAQRVNGSGAVLWTVNGVQLTAAVQDQVNCRAVTDGSNGAIVVWEDARAGTNIDVYAQRVNSAGAVQWTADGAIVTTDPGDQAAPRAVADGSGGVIVAWEDQRVFPSDIYAQRLNSAGTIQWIATDLPICTAANVQAGCQIVTDGVGGAIIAWADLRNANFDIFAQRVTKAGVPQWTADGVAISTAANDQEFCKLASDGFGGAVIVWEDNRGANIDLYGQGVSAGGDE